MPLAYDGPATYEAVDLTTLAEVRLLLNPDDASDTSTDALINSLISDVSAMLTSLLCWHTLEAAREEIYPMRRFQRILTLDSRPIDTTAETPGIKIHINTDFSNVLDMDTTLYAINESMGVIRFLSPPIRDSFVQVDYTGGLETSAANVLTNYPEIAHAATMQVKYLYNRRDSLGGNVESFAGSTSFDRAYGLHPEVKRMLLRHARGGGF